MLERNNINYACGSLWENSVITHAVVQHKEFFMSALKDKRAVSGNNAGL